MENRLDPFLTSLLDGYYKQIITDAAAELRDKTRQRDQVIQQHMSAALDAAFSATKPHLQAIEAELGSKKDAEKQMVNDLARNLPAAPVRSLWEAEHQPESNPDHDSRRYDKILNTLRSLQDLSQEEPEAAGPTPAGSPGYDLLGLQPSSSGLRLPVAVGLPAVQQTFIPTPSFCPVVQNKRAADSAEDGMDFPSGPPSNKRARTSASNSYTFPSPVEETNREQTSQGRRYRDTVLGYQVEGIHWIFPHAATGSGFYVLLCDEEDQDAGETPTHTFVKDPWIGEAARKHFNSQRSCHGHPFCDTIVVTDAMIMQRFGYLVEDMTEETCRSSNGLLEDKQHALEAKKKKQSKAKATTKYSTPRFQPIQRNPQGGPAPPADMGQKLSGTGFEGQVAARVAAVRSDLV